MKKILQALLLVLLIPILLAGCGGGGGDGGGDSVTPATRTVDFNAGMSWDFAGSYTYGNGSQSTTGNVTLSQSTFIATYEGESSMVLSSNFFDTVSNQNLQSRQIIYQDGNWNLRVHANDSGTLLSDVTILPGNWQEGLSVSGTVENENFSEFFSLTVLNAERVKVIAGTFDTWKCRVEKNSSTYRTTGDYWYAPEIGQYVKAVYTTTFISGEFAGNVGRYNVSLTATNLD